MLPISPSDLQKKGRGSVCGEMGYIPLSLPGKSPRLRYLFSPLVIYGAESWFRTRKEEGGKRDGCIFDSRAADVKKISSRPGIRV